MLNKLATAKVMGVRAYHSGGWLEDNPFTEAQLRRIWEAAFLAENHKYVERMRQREANDGNDE
jgi:hypothetical protein